MAASFSVIRDKRHINPRKIFTPTETNEVSPSNYLVYIPDTVSYTIVGRSSVKKIQGKTATLVFNKKEFTGEISFAGNP